MALQRQVYITLSAPSLLLTVPGVCPEAITGWFKLPLKAAVEYVQAANDAITHQYVRI